MDTTLSRPSAGHLLDGRYRVDSWVARGGMAAVYLGTDMRLGRTVALKIAHSEYANDPEFARRFIDEARAVARLSSQNVVAVYDQGCDGDVLYLAMEYIAGHTLRDLLNERGRLDPDEALDIVEGVLLGLAAAHREGIIHRDVKPENVLLGSENTIKVADFGLARAVAGAEHTRTGMIIGTAAYLAPEQVSRSTSDARTDVYAAGVLLFEMVTGTQPHTGDTPLAVAYKHVNDVVPAPSSVVPGLPPALDALVALATNRDPDMRPADAGRFLQAIFDVRHGLQLAPLGVPVQHTAAMPSPPPGAYYEASANHTLVVPALGLADLDGDWPDGYPRSRGKGRRGGYRGRSEPRLQRLLFSRTVFYLAGLVAVVLVAGVVAWWVTTGRYSTVPQVRGMAASTASTELHNLGFAVTIARATHSDLPQGEVISTDPRSGSRMPRGHTVRIIESLGPLMIRVPSVTGMTVASAERQLESAHLKPGQVRDVASSTIPVGVVVSTSPVAGTSWPENKPVTITVSAGQPLPKLVGQQLAAAEQAAQSGGFELNPVEDASSNTPAGTITSQSPAAGSPITPNEVVTVHVSPGPPMVAVPNVVGASVTEATKVLEQAGFQVSVDHVGPGSTVLSESPSGQAPRGSTITLTVSFL
jgi:eukaryotic-like serine/threonine-protein kinase